MLESAIQAAIIKALRAEGCYVVNVSVAESGTPDLLVCCGGRFVALEVKQPGNYPTKIQRHRLGQVEAAGGVAAVVRSVREALEIARPRSGEERHGAAAGN